MMKAYTTVNATKDAMVEVQDNIEHRRKWDKAIADFKVFSVNDDKTVKR